MAEGRSRDEWGRMSSLLALIANVNRDPRRTRAFKPADFNPYPPAEASAKAGEARRPGGGVPLTKKNIGLLKRIFVDPSAKADRKGE